MPPALQPAARRADDIGERTRKDGGMPLLKAVGTAWAAFIGAVAAGFAFLTLVSPLATTGADLAATMVSMGVGALAAGACTARISHGLASRRVSARWRSAGRDQVAARG
jgi:hypothetical protein